MFSGIFLDNTRLRGRLKVGYYTAMSVLKGKKWERTKGRCVICGKMSSFFYYTAGFEQYGVDPKDETGFCWQCGSQNRNRALAKILVKNFFRSEDSDLSRAIIPAESQIYLAAANGALFDALRENNDILYSEYFNDTPPGEYKGVIQCQDLTKLTYSEQTVDVVMSEHVMEHVSDPDKAFAEIARILKPGGLLIMSIPYEASGASTTRITPDMQDLLPRKYHKDPLRNEGALVFSDFSRGDFVERYLKPAGFQGEIMDVIDEGNGISISPVIMAKKLA